VSPFFDSRCICHMGGSLMHVLVLGDPPQFLQEAKNCKFGKDFRGRNSSGNLNVSDVFVDCSV